MSVLYSNAIFYSLCSISWISAYSVTLSHAGIIVCFGSKLRMHILKHAYFSHFIDFLIVYKILGVLDFILQNCDLIFQLYIAI